MENVLDSLFSEGMGLAFGPLIFVIFQSGSNQKYQDVPVQQAVDWTDESDFFAFFNGVGGCKNGQYPHRSVS